MEPQSPQEARKQAVTLLSWEEEQECAQVVPIHTSQRYFNWVAIQQEAASFQGSPQLYSALGSIIPNPMLTSPSKYPEGVLWGPDATQESPFKIFFKMMTFPTGF